MSSGNSFFSKLEALQAKNKSHLMVGIDPRVPSDSEAFLKSEWVRLGVYQYLKQFVKSIVDACRGEAASVKMQSAFFEMHGVDGLRALLEGVEFIHDRGMLVLLDAKRGDIATTMEAYYKASFDQLKADALTVQLYMGTDVLKPFFDSGFWKNYGVYVVLYSSNPSAKELQRQTLLSGKSFLGHFTEAISACCQGDVDKLKSVGYVVGATNPVESWASLGLEKSSLLLPGVGAQGGSITKKTFEHCYGPSTSVPVSRGLLAGTGSADSWEHFQAQVKKNAKSLKAKIGYCF